MKEREIKEITIDELTSQTKKLFKEVISDESQYIISDDEGNQAILMEYEGFMELLLSMREMMQSIMEDDPYEHDFDITPLINKLTEEDNEFLLDLIHFNYVNEEVANAYIDGAISEEELITVIFNDAEEDISLDHDFIAAIENLDDDLFELIIENETEPELIQNYFDVEYTREEFIKIIESGPDSNPFKH